MILAPSILSADFARLGEEIVAVDKAGAEYIHIDVMDGMFVPSISFGFPVIESIRPYTDRVFDVHLMIMEPERYIERFAKAGADIITVHVEAAGDVAKILRDIHALGKKAGITLKPETPVETIYPYLEMVDMVLIMTVNPGFGGQKYMEECTPKITAVRNKIEELGLKVDVQADGGVNKDNAGKILEAGANILVSGTTVFGTDVQQNVAEFLEIGKRLGK